MTQAMQPFKEVVSWTSVWENQSINFVIKNSTSVNLAVISLIMFNYDLIKLSENSKIIKSIYSMKFVI